jgi:hypothetical protein
MFYVDDDFIIYIDRLENGYYRIKKTYKKNNSNTFMTLDEKQAKFVSKELNKLIEKEL